VSVIATLGWMRAAQNPQTLRVDVRLVNVVATVADSKGTFVSSLTADDFTLYEDGVAQKIAHFTQDRDVPVSVGIVLDTSGSMTSRIGSATAGITRFIESIHADDDVFIMTFARNVSLVQDFTSDRRKLSRALGSIRIEGGTAFYDGVRHALEKIKEGRHDKKAILVFSDAMDMGSKATLEDVLLNVRRSEVLVYGLGTDQTTYADTSEHVPFTLPTPASAGRGPRNTRPAAGGRGAVASNGVNLKVLNQLSTSSGGQEFLLSGTVMDTGFSRIDAILAQIADEMRSQYTLGYYPSAPDNGQFHSIRVVTRPEYRVRTRAGYQGRE